MAPQRQAREAQQAAIVALGRFALESGQIDATFARALELVASGLDAPSGLLVRIVGASRVRTLGGCGAVGLLPGEEFEVPEGFFGPAEAERDLGGARVDERLFPVPHRDGAQQALSSLAVTIPAGGRPWGHLVVLDSRQRRYEPGDLDFLLAIGHLLAAAVERDRSASAQAAVVAFGRFALQSRDLAATISRAVDLVTQILEAPMAALVRTSPAGRAEVLHSRGPAGAIFGQGFSVARETVSAYAGPEPVAVGDWRTESRFPMPEAVRAAGVVSSLSVTVPQEDHLCRLGVLDVRPRRFTATEVDVVQWVAQLLAAALERDRIEARLEDTTRQLQRALLPAALPVVAGIELAARYVPAGGDRVGGDWYDVLTLPHGGIGLVVGDVEGHDSTAAALMGQIRNVLRAYAAEGHPPAEIIARVNRFVALHTERLVTCCYAELHADEPTVTAVTAGHPAPWSLHPDGALLPLPVAPGVVLGVAAEQRYVERTSVLPAGCCLLLVTDGLVDDFPGVLHLGEGALEAVSRAVVGESVETLADRLVARPPGALDLRDDAALLAVRLTAGGASGSGAVSRVFGNSPAANPAARRLVTDLLTCWELEALRDPAILAVSELVTNVVLHTTSVIRLTVCRTGPVEVWIGVHDTSDRLPPAVDPGVTDRDALDPDAPDPDAVDLDSLQLGGRGLRIVDQLADTWGVTATPGGSGKTVWLQLSVDSRTAPRAGVPARSPV